MQHAPVLLATTFLAARRRSLPGNRYPAALRRALENWRGPAVATVGGAAACALVLAVAGCRPGGAAAGDRANAPSEALPVTKVVAAETQLRTWPQSVRVQGTLVGDERVIVGAKVAGRIETVGLVGEKRLVDLGTPVQAGDVLARLEDEEFQLRVQQAEAQLEQVRAALGLGRDADEQSLDPEQVPAVVQEKVLWDEARSNWERAEALHRETAISVEQLDQRKALADVAAARYQSALHTVNESIALLRVRRAELALARQTLEDTVIRAPFAGIVESRFIAPGAYVQVGQPIAALVKVDPLRFRAGVPERDAVRMRLGQAVRVFVEGAAEPLPAQVDRISPSLDVSSRALTIEADVANPGMNLHSGLFAEAEIVVDPEARTLAVPAGAVREFAGVEKVWLVRDGAAAEQQVQTGVRNEQWVEILAGLAAGDVVVAGDPPKQAGPVEVTRSTGPG